MRCPKANCGGEIIARMDGLGRVAYACPRCARKKARRCQDCDRRTPSPWFWRCARCTKQRRRALERVRDRKRYAKRRASAVRQWKRRMADPAFRAHRAAYMAEYRRAHPRDWTDRAYSRAYMRAKRANPAYRAREQARKRALRRSKRQMPAAA